MENACDDNLVPPLINCGSAVAFILFYFTATQTFKLSEL